LPFVVGLEAASCCALQTSIAAMHNLAWCYRSANLTFLLVSQVLEIKMTKTTAKRSFFRTALDAIVEARSREAQRIVDNHVAKGIVNQSR
jgi:hypothetical protein